jgi:curved DNA-binding protein
VGDGVGKAGQTAIFTFTSGVLNDAHWTLVGKDIHCTEQVDLFIVLLGGEILVNTLDGEVKLKIKPETANGSKIRVRGKGYPSYKNEGPQGDFIVIVDVKLPSNLDAKQKKLFGKLAGYQK